MALKPNSTNGHSTTLNEAMASLVQSNVLLVQTQADLTAQMADARKEHAELARQADARFARFEAQMAEIIRVLNEHSRVFERLPDTIHDKIGFKPSV